VIIAQDTDLRGDIEIGTGSVLHPRCTILAMMGPILLGCNCIVEENAVIVNRTKQKMVIGDDNVFQVGCRVESPSIGSSNTFGVKCRVVATVGIGSHVNVGAGCVVLPRPLFITEVPTTESETNTALSRVQGNNEPPPLSLMPPPLPPKTETVSNATEKLIKETLPDFTVVFGADNRRRTWTGEGIGQVKAFHEKHLLYLRETLPKYNKLKMV
jgi:dynactin-6